MKIKTVHIHNFRSIKDSIFNLDDYSLLIGENNSGKTNMITALRLFYEDNIKYKEELDFPKFETEDNESWIEIEFLLTEQEFEQLKSEYKSKDRTLKVRKYFKSEDKDRVKAKQSNIYAYKNGKLSKNLFYGAKNISQAKLGKVIHIPDISKTDDTLKLTGPSPFRDIINFVMKKVINSSEAYRELAASFDDFNENFKCESSQEGFSIEALVSDINKEIHNWEIKFGLTINPIRPEDIVKNLISHYIEDKSLNGERISINSCGQGLQRHLIYTLIRLSAKYVDKNEPRKNDFCPDFRLILFEEPEAFLHPSQQENLNVSLKSLSNQGNQQILITTHSPVFVSKNVEDLTCLCKIKKENGISSVFQLNKQDIQNLWNENLGLLKEFSNLLNDDNTDEEIKRIIRQRKLAQENIDEEKRLEEEAIKYFLWLDAERSSMFFAKHVLICEGASEKVLFDHLFNTKWRDLKDKNIYILDAMGKFNIHRYINILDQLGISHSILLDGDNNKDIQGIINKFILKNTGRYTREIYFFDTDIENFLDIEKIQGRSDLKPLNILIKYKEGSISEEKIKELRKIVEQLL